MKNENRISKDEIIKKMTALSDIYDVVRLVEPETTTVISFEEDGIKRESQDPCFSVWDKGERCINCISLKACVENKRFTKFEFRDEQSFNVVAMPYLIVDGEEEIKVSLELVNKVSGNLILEADGLDVESQKIMELNQKLYQDSLTGAFNRRYYDEYRYIYDMSHAMPKKLGYLILNINKFKEINAKYGHKMGDELLAKVSEILKQNIRNADRVMRIDGDEFLIVMRDCDKLFMEKKIFQLKRAVNKIRLPWIGKETISIAVGMSYTDRFLGKQAELEELFTKADRDMHENKKEPENYSAERNILIVDDLEMNRTFLKGILKDRYVLYEATDGKEGLKVLENHQIDLVITDIFMDGMNGYDFMKTMKLNLKFRDIPIIAVTENIESSQKEAIEAGADIYVDRPLSGYHILDVIQRLTGKDHGRKELFDMEFLLETIPGAIIIYKKLEDELKVLSCSRGITQVTGWDSDDICNFSKEENIKAVYPDDLQKFLDAFNRMLKTHSRAEIIYRGYKKDGTIVWIWFQGRYIGEEDGHPIIEAILLDVSNNTNMYQSILDDSTSAITVVDANTFEVLYVNKRAMDLVGLQEIDYVGKKCYECVFHKKEPCDHCIENFKDKEWIETEMEFNNIPYRQLFRRILWHGMEAYLEYTTDISTEKENMAYAEKQKNQHSQILNNIPVGIIVYRLTDQELTLVDANNTICEMMSLKREKLKHIKNEEFFVLAHEDDREYCRKVLEQLAVPGTELEYEFRSFDRKKNDYVWMNGHGISELQVDGTVYIYLAYRDTTERKKLEETRQALMTTQKTAEAKSEFYSRMSHDMRTPMNGILGITELSKDDYDTDSLRDGMNKIDESGRYMLQLINDTLDYQRIESGRMKINPDIEYGRTIVTDGFNMIKTAAKNKNVDLIVNTEEANLNHYVRVDAMRLKQVFMNVLSNAVKFTPEGGKVSYTIKNSTEDGIIYHDIIEISDTGIGMSQEFIQKELYKPFSQEKNEYYSLNVGSGLGLSIVKSLVEQMNGTIEVESEIGNGTTFTIYLDIEVVKDEEALKYLEQKKKRNKDVDIQLNGKRILLFEDHVLNAEIVKRLVAKVGADIEWAKDGVEGLEMFTNSDIGYYDGILMDIRMPRMDGLETTKNIRNLDREDAKTIPIIAMSANTYEEDVRKSIEVGMNEHLGKPVDTKEMYRVLDQYMN